MLASIILAGGESKRFGGNKLIASVDGEAVINRVFSEMSKIVDKVYISIKYEMQKNTLEKYLSKNSSKGTYEFILDYYDGEGPLNAILSSMDKITAEEYIIVPGDIPWIKAEIIKKLIEYGRENKSTLASPIWGNGWSESLILYFNKCRCKGLIKVLRWLRRAGRATDIQRTVSKMIFIPISMLTEDPTVFVHVNTRESLINPKPRNPLNGHVNKIVNIDRTLWSKSHFILALEAVSDGDHITALNEFMMELNEYLPHHLMQLINHTLSDMIQLTK